MMEATNPGRGGVRRAIFAGAASSVVGIGLARFAYTPLIPVLILARWFDPGQAAYLGAANLAGYLVGALSARHLVERLPIPLVLRAMMLLATATFFACALPSPFVWFLPWRLASGFAGGVLMVVAAPAVLADVPAARRGLAAGIIFTGVGLGIAASGTLVPLMLGFGLTATWCGLGTLALLLTAASWRAWPSHPASPASPVAAATMAGRRSAGRLRVLYLIYALNAVGLVPHMVFLVDYVARGLGHGVAVGAWYWVLFGLGACIGPLLAGRFTDLVGGGAALRVALLLQAVAVALACMGGSHGGLVVSTLTIGALTPGIVSIVLGRVHELAADDIVARTAAWSRATVAFAIGQAMAAYAFSWLFARTNDYRLLFVLGAGTFAAALLIDLATALWARPTPPDCRT